MDNELLVRLLTQVPKLIIPGFGAFLRKEGIGTLVFSPFLKRDDGVLVKIISDEYGVSLEDAHSMIGEWVDSIHQTLAEKSKYHIDGIGLLMLDSNGAISMVNEIQDSSSSSLEEVGASGEEVHSHEDLAPRSIVGVSALASSDLQETTEVVLDPSDEVRRGATQMMESLQQTLQSINHGQSSASQPVLQSQSSVAEPQPVAAQPQTVVSQPQTAIAQPQTSVAQPQRPYIPQPSQPQVSIPQPQPQPQPQSQPQPQVQQVASPQPRFANQQPVGAIPRPLVGGGAQRTAVGQQPSSTVRPQGAVGVRAPHPHPHPHPQQGANRLPVSGGSRSGVQRPMSGQQPRPNPTKGQPSAKPQSKQQALAAKGNKPSNAKSPQNPQKKMVKRRAPQSPQKKKVELLLIIAIIVATMITILIIYSLLTTNPTTEFYLP
ncbi:MAG: hypothetical protein R3Y19_03890 [Rikenellaceae bacterium]